MKRTTQLLGIALVGVVALLVPSKADAFCGTALSFGAYYSSLTGATNGPSLRANFWALDAGVPAIGPGVDNGAAVDTGIWIVPYPAAGDPLKIRGDWNSVTTYDGCPNNLPNAGTSSMVFSASDVDGTGNMIYAVACVTRNPQAGVQYNLDLPPGCTAANCAPIAMVQAPRAVISNSVRTAGSNDVTITVASPNFAPGFYSDGSAACTAAAAIPQYDVYRQQTARDVPPSPSLDAGPWVLAATCAIGTPCTLPAITSPTNTDIVLATSPHFNSNFTTGEAADGAAARVGQKSLKINAGPVIAVTPKPKVVPNPRTQAPGQQNQQ
jgi:hypothetical protein